MDVVVEGRRILDTSTGEVITEFGDRNSRPSLPEAVKIFDRTSIGARSHRPRAADLPADYHGLEPYWCPHSLGDLWLCIRCNMGMERTDGVQIKRATEAQKRGAESRPDISWHYVSPSVWLGRSPQGHDFALERGRIARIYSLRQREEALALVAEYGLTAASRKAGIPRTTLKNLQTRKAVAA